MVEHPCDSDVLELVLHLQVAPEPFVLGLRQPVVRIVEFATDEALGFGFAEELLLELLLQLYFSCLVVEVRLVDQLLLGVRIIVLPMHVLKANSSLGLLPDCLG